MIITPLIMTALKEVLAQSTVERNHGCASGCGQDKDCGTKHLGCKK